MRWAAWLIRTAARGWGGFGCLGRAFCLKTALQAWWFFCGLDLGFVAPNWGFSPQAFGGRPCRPAEAGGSVWGGVSVLYVRTPVGSRSDSLPLADPFSLCPLCPLWHAHDDDLVRGRTWRRIVAVAGSGTGVLAWGLFVRYQVAWRGLRSRLSGGVLTTMLWSSPVWSLVRIESPGWTSLGAWTTEPEAVSVSE